MRLLRQTAIFSLRSLATVALLLCTATVVAALWTMHSKHIRLFEVRTGSMSPALKAGDGVLVEPFKANKVRVGDVVSFRFSHGSSLVSHRVIKIDNTAHQLVTKGDYNPQPDGQLAFSDVKGRAFAIVPKIGIYRRVVHNPIALVTLVYIPTTILFAAQYHKIRVGLSATYRANGQRQTNNKTVLRSAS